MFHSMITHHSQDHYQKNLKRSQGMDQFLPSNSAPKPANLHMLDLPVQAANKELMDGYHTWTTQLKRHEGSITCEGEDKIREQIESDIERELEEEIKDGIYRLALRLHRLYKHKRERNIDQTKVTSPSMFPESSLWLNISIGLTEGGTKVEIKEMMNKQKCRMPQTGTRLLANNVGGNKFEWTKSLRATPISGAGSRRKIGGSCKAAETTWKF